MKPKSNPPAPEKPVIRLRLSSQTDDELSRLEQEQEATLKQVAELTERLDQVLRPMDSAPSSEIVSELDTSLARRVGMCRVRATLLSRQLAHLASRIDLPERETPPWEQPGYYAEK